MSPRAMLFGVLFGSAIWGLLCAGACLVWWWFA